MLNKYILPDKFIRSRIIDKETVLLNLKDNSIYFLNPTGNLIWNLANGKTKVQKIIDAICKDFKVDYKLAEKDAFSFIKGLSKKKMLNLYDKPKSMPKD